jgi:hypothetical protein
VASLRSHTRESPFTTHTRTHLPHTCHTHTHSHTHTPRTHTQACAAAGGHTQSRPAADHEPRARVRPVRTLLLVVPLVLLVLLVLLMWVLLVVDRRPFNRTACFLSSVCLSHRLPVACVCCATA